MKSAAALLAVAAVAAVAPAAWVAAAAPVERSLVRGPAAPGGSAPDASPLASTDPESAGLSAARLARLHRFLEDEVRARRYPGAIVLLARHGRVVDWRAVGHRNVAGTEPLARDAIARIYSLTKIVTSVAVLMLVEEGRLGLDDPLARHLPAFGGLRVLADGTADGPTLRAPVRPPTIRHLLTHTAGFATGGAGVPGASARLEAAALDDAGDLADYVARLARVPLALDPGTRFDYDGVATVVLGRLVEVVAGVPFERFLAERVFGPLRMRDTGFEVPLAERGRVIEMATTDADGRLVPSPAFAGRAPGARLNRYASGAGGLYSTAADLARFAQALANGGELAGARLLAPASVAQMTASQLGPGVGGSAEFRPGEGFGLGVAVVTDAGRLARLGSVGAWGWSGAASTWLTVDPRTGLVAILLAQHLPLGGPRDPGRLAVPFYNLVYASLVDVP